MKLTEKLANAKREIKETKLKKEGKNTFSNYAYFTPSQIELLVQQACFNNRMVTKFDLVRDALGVYGTLTIFDLDSDDNIVFTMASAIPEIKATNIAQQLGGCVTYTERYLKTSAFGITDNNLDFDNHDNRPKEKESVKTISNEEVELLAQWNSELEKCKTLDDVTSLYNKNKPTDTNILSLFTKRKAIINAKG